MDMISVAYLFDPLCGWCYGAAPVISALAQTEGLVVGLSPTGLFAFDGGRPMTADFAAYAWKNDQRIEQLTGQVFSPAYKANVLDAEGGRFDSGVLSLALTAVALEDHRLELAVLKGLSQHRYVEGADTARLDVVIPWLRDHGQKHAADRLEAQDEAFIHITKERLRGGQALMKATGARGVPALVVQRAEGLEMLDSQLLFGPPEALMSAIFDA